MFSQGYYPDHRTEVTQTLEDESVVAFSRTALGVAQ